MSVTALSPDSRRRPPVGRLSPTARKAAVILHVISSVSWLALMLCLLTLGTAGLTTRDAETLRSAYRAMQLLGGVLILPLSLLTLVSGLILSLGTPWGLFRFRWISTKFWLTLAAAAASLFAFTARLNEAAHVVAQHPTGPISAMNLGFIRYNLVIIPAVALIVYTSNVVLSVVKPWGRRTSSPRKGVQPT
ncbi:DUF2269 domain-containing protein [Kitasatospora kifunensis]|uniref:Putative membrane protein n=1 Tax=Kitasatospora kifunensis TaxID=58351 RepID=A0A7W7R2S6_KITKI|nr:DUF2269 domain-containing protein [Kitasatospora kifunensis]MBB4924362.1 putative membrane protein [Kitasatospora kifunensis]